ncbi:SurA N-terminal domain-containing protein [Persephonella sp.]
MFTKISESKWMKFVLFITTFAFVGTAFVAIVIYKFTGNISGAAVVNGREIPLKEFYYQVNVLQNRLESQGIDTAPLKKEIYDQALEAVIDRELLFQEAEKEGLAATKEEVKKAILDAEIFKEDGKFSKERYIAILSSMDLSPQLFEEILKKDLSAKHLFTILDVSFYLSPEEINSYVNKQLSKITGKFLYIKPKDIKIPEKEIKEYYETHKKEYVGKKGKEIVVYKIDIQNTDQDKAEKLAKDLFLKLKKDIKVSGNKDINLIFEGSIYDENKLDTLPVEVRNKLKELSPDKKIIFVKTDDAYYLSKFIREVAEPLPYEKVKEEIIITLKRKYEKDQVENLYEEVKKDIDKSLKDISKKFGGKIEKIKDTTIRDIVVQYGLPTDYMNQLVKEKRGAMKLPDGVLVYIIEEISLPSKQEAEELKKLIKPILRNEKYNVLVQMYIDKLREKADIKRNSRIFR